DQPLWLGELPAQTPATPSFTLGAALDTCKAAGLSGAGVWRGRPPEAGGGGQGYGSARPQVFRGLVTRHCILRGLLTLVGSFGWTNFVRGIMRQIACVVGSVLLLGMGLALPLVSQTSASNSSQEANAPQSDSTDAVPAFHAEAPTGDLPETMSPELFKEPIVQNAYAVAAKIKKVLYQQPCYCHCDKHKGHTSLLDCFASNHGAGCGTCVYEDFYSYE